MTLNSMNDLMVHQLRDLYSAERQVLLVWPQLAELASSHSLTIALEHHRDETVRHIARLDEIFELLDLSPRGVRCRGMEGLLVDALADANAQTDPALRDSSIVANCQRVEGYELAVYGTSRIFAESLELDRVVTLLEQTLAEEEAADAALAAIAESETSPAALAATRRALSPQVVGMIHPDYGGRNLRITV